MSKLIDDKTLSKIAFIENNIEANNEDDTKSIQLTIEKVNKAEGDVMNEIT